MSNYHVLESFKNDRATIAFHIPVPVENNGVSVPLRTAVAQYVSGEAVTQVPWLLADFPAEHAQIQNGEIYEQVETVEYDANLTNAQKQAQMDNRFAVLNTAVVNRLRDVLKFWGFNRDVP
jgi:hypothetical protein